MQTSAFHPMRPLHRYPMADAHVIAFSTTRHGGCGQGTYGTFNCTPYTGDTPSVVVANQQLLCRLLGIEAPQLVIPYQTHHTHIVTIDEDFLYHTPEKRFELLQNTDALITSKRGICLSISTADCIPVLLYDRRHHVTAAIHAGWRGTVAGIVFLTLQQMQRDYGTTGTDLQAIIGPGISLEAFEVGQEVYDTFSAQAFPMDRIARWYPEAEKYHIDLPEANRLQLLHFGIPDEQIHCSGICTYSHPDDFFSARRLGIHSGRILSGILIK